MDIVLRSVFRRRRLRTVPEAVRQAGPGPGYDLRESCASRWAAEAAWRQRYFDALLGPGEVFTSITRGRLTTELHRSIGMAEQHSDSFKFLGRGLDNLTVLWLRTVVRGSSPALPVPVRIPGPAGRFCSASELHAFMLQDLDELDRFLTRLIDAGHGESLLVVNPPW